MPSVVRVAMPEAAPQERRGGIGAGLHRRHSDSEATIFSTTSGAGLYFASSPRSLAKVGSFVGYGRYSITSVTQRAAFGMPFAWNAASSCAWVAVLAFTFCAVAAGVLAPVAGAAMVGDDAAATVGGGGRRRGCCGGAGRSRGGGCGGRGR